MANRYRYSIKTGACNVCGKVFTFSHATGRHPAICSDECRAVSKKDWEAGRKRLVCEVDGCGKEARPGLLPICMMHYHRRYRTGTTDQRPAPGPRVSEHGYSVVCIPNHPMKPKSQNGSYVHRVVAYEKYGPGPHPCHWCGAEVDWDKAHVDHLNGVKLDNGEENLVFSCPRCNGARGIALSFLRRLQKSRVDQVSAMIAEALS